MKLSLDINLADGTVTGFVDKPSTHNIPPATDQAKLGRSGVHARNLGPRDLVYMRHIHDNAFHRLSSKGKAIPDIFAAILVGSQSDLNEARNGSMDRLDVQPERSAFSADPAGWVAQYHIDGNQHLIRAYGEWMAEMLARP